ncbi:neurofilament medium polypeptide-like [Polypterus senegalus]|uniref:neurofilament medium polypeptide-like n=1 Tax=Polypterus senegalus TaxID=55291 RepID=UPI001964C1BA|nr:neurofilament medium polypeptide-like [Polypterus senegalus]
MSVHRVYHGSAHVVYFNNESIFMMQRECICFGIFLLLDIMTGDADAAPLPVYPTVFPTNNINGSKKLPPEVQSQQFSEVQNHIDSRLPHKSNKVLSLRSLLVQSGNGGPLLGKVRVKKSSTQKRPQKPGSARTDETNKSSRWSNLIPGYPRLSRLVVLSAAIIGGLAAVSLLLWFKIMQKGNLEHVVKEEIVEKKESKKKKGEDKVPIVDDIKHEVVDDRDYDYKHHDTCEDEYREGDSDYYYDDYDEAVYKDEETTSTDSREDASEGKTESEEEEEGEEEEEEHEEDEKEDMKQKIMGMAMENIMGDGDSLKLGAEKLKEATGKVKEMSKNIKGKVKEVKGKVKEVKGKVKDTAKKVKGKVKDTGKKIKGNVKKMKGKVKDMSKKIKGKVKNLKGKVKNMGKKMKGKVKNLGKKMKGLGKKMKGKVKNVGKKIKGIGKKLKGMRGKMKGLGKKMKGLGKKLKGFGKKMKGFGKKMKGFGKKKKKFSLF